MSPDLISNVTKYKDNYLIISGVYGDKTLSILDKELNTLSEHKFEGISMWGADFHIDENNLKILISVITTDTFPIETINYQGFNTLWYEVVDCKEGFRLTLIETLGKSNITRVQSKFIDGKRYWVALRQMHFITHTGVKTYRSILNFAISENLEAIPKFGNPYGLNRAIDSNFDFTYIDNNYYLSIIGKHGGDVPTILRINRINRYIEYIELDIPLKKLHDFESTKLLNIEGKLYSYFWINSQERSKTYKFEMYKVDINRNSLMQCSFKRIIDSNFVHEVVWSDYNRVSYKKVYNENKKYIAEATNTGELTEIAFYEGWFPIFFADNNNIICLNEKRDKLKIINNE
jgi:hypothetical protein